MIRTIPLPSGKRLITDDHGTYEVWKGTQLLAHLRLPQISKDDLAVILHDRDMTRAPSVS